MFCSSECDIKTTNNFSLYFLVLFIYYYDILHVLCPMCCTIFTLKNNACNTVTKSKPADKLSYLEILPEIVML